MNRKLFVFLIAVSLLAAVLITGGSVVIHLKKGEEQEKLIQQLDSAMVNMEEPLHQRQISLSRWYNFCLTAGHPPVNFEDSYDTILNVGDGMMGWIDFPSLGLKYPLYHGTKRERDTTAIEHVPGSAFPIGGEGNHSIFYAPGQVQDLKEGDMILIHILKDSLVYEVSQVRTVSLGYAGGLESQAGEDLCTLVAGVHHGGENQKVLINLTRVPPETEAELVSEASQKPMLDESILQMIAYAVAGVLLLPVCTGCVGWLVYGVVRGLSCVRLTKKTG